MFGDKYLRILWRQKGNYENTRLEWHKLMMKMKKNYSFEFVQILLLAYWSVGLTCQTCAVFLLVA